MDIDKQKTNNDDPDLPSWEEQRRPLKGYTLGSIYVGPAEPKRKPKGGKKWQPPKVSFDAPDFCKEQGFSDTTCFECKLPTCYFDTIPERINKKRKKKPKPE